MSNHFLIETIDHSEADGNPLKGSPDSRRGQNDSGEADPLSQIPEELKDAFSDFVDTYDPESEVSIGALVQHFLKSLENQTTNE
jgi:hypothetical protein